MGNESEAICWDPALRRDDRGESTTEHVLLLNCPNGRGMAHQVSCFLTEQGCHISDAAQHSDARAQRLFMRIRFSSGDPADVSARFGTFAARFHMEWTMHDALRPIRVVVMVSKFGHCLNDLLFRAKHGLLAVEICAVVSNHTDCADLAASYQIPFFHFPVQAPVSGATAGHEERLIAFLNNAAIDLVVLARYMQVLSPGLCRLLSGRVVNIHHSFLPSFKGAKPYGQAYERGVKLIGATAHFVTEDLDEGPIIEQEVIRVDHTHAPEQLSALGTDTECIVLARAIKWIAEFRVILDGRKTVIFN
ncbi:formyltetrahydrofolate deformylase [Janthinobacterium agaricidamnosum]|uniref:Formyltetrahydrofolate deformylase n=1 Tax=Janthinobacterium agaricidamnosum NBRC 102515 = DSM 9628 TaxID=1349767 RepID=W0V2I2_9BURK|nr:formyltetrahydrofolate deformylase [Janthinobacterium agaricidamnosum]CDG81558.1 formyltetrahydrofolate deformylase [Janthinobacterium agaricidamnosum NBRC 102515 = DSM 9628]